MRAILKMPEPRSLTEYRAGANINYERAYDEFPAKGNIRDHLWKEQRGLCAFCGFRIFNDPLKMKIAHWKPRKLKLTDENGKESFPNLPDQLSYWNMLGCCNGNEGQPPEKQHCDTHQANLPLSRNPADAGHRIEDFVAFGNDGSVFSENDGQLNRELGCRKKDGTFEEGVLNLNLSFLRTNRKEVLEGFKDGVLKRGRLTKEQIARMLTDWRGDTVGELRPYAPVVAYWLRKRLARNP